MTRGEIYYIKNNKLEDGCMPCPDRPAVIVSNDMLNEVSNVVEIVYMTVNPWKDLSTHVVTRAMGAPSTILCEQVYSLNKLKIGNYAGALSDEELKAVDAALAISLGLDFEASAPVPREIVKTVEVEKVVMREPTEEELDRLLNEREEKRFEEAMEEARRRMGMVMPSTDSDITFTMPYHDKIKLETERDIYRNLYEDMMNTFMVIAKGAKA